jgi:two-component system, repressor protein LuxO
VNRADRRGRKPEKGETKKALVVEDRPSDSIFIKEALRGLDLEVDQARNGLQAIKLLRRKRYALVITDLLMPEKTGFEVLAWLDEKQADIPVVVCSAYLSPATMRLLRRYDRLAIVAKPYKKDSLRTAASGLLGDSPSEQGEKRTQG